MPPTDSEINRRFDSMEAQLAGINQTLEKLARIEERVAGYNENQNRLAECFDELTEKVQTLEIEAASRGALIKWAERGIWGLIVAGAAAAVGYFR